MKAIYQYKKQAEYYALSGGLLLLLLFSLSRFQLPFYTNALFPLFAIITARVCFDQLSKFGTAFRLIGQWLFIVLLPAAIIIIHVLLKPANNLFFILDVALFVIIVILVIAKIKEGYEKVFFLNCAAALFAGFYVCTVFYNEMVPYKGQIAAAGYASQKPFDNFHLYALTTENNIFQFYCKRPVDLVPIEQFNSFKPKGVSIFYVNEISMVYLKQTHADFKIIREFADYPMENIQLDFINKENRYKVLDHVYLITK